MLVLVSAFASLALAHQTRTVGEGSEQYNVIVGFVHEPAFTEERNGLDLIIRRTSNDEPIEGLAESLNAEITSPDGTQTRTFTLRAQYGKPGYYMDDIVLTQAGEYTLRIWGFIGGTEFDETFQTHEVRELAALRFP
jgi:hypothetical protein